MVDSGHQIGIHGWSHINLGHGKVDNETRYHEVHDLEVALFNVLGKYPTYFRPPYGDCLGECVSQMSGMGYHVVTWDVDTEDWKYSTPDTWEKAVQIYSKLTADPRVLSWRPYLVLLHDVLETTATQTLLHILQRVRVFGRNRLNVTVGACLNDPPENWYRIPGPDWDPNPSQRYWDMKAAEQARRANSEDDGDN